MASSANGIWATVATTRRKTGELLLQINGQRVEKVGQVRRLAEQFDTQPLTLKIMRDQTPRNLTLQP